MMSDVSPGTGGVVDCPLGGSERRGMPPQSQTLEPRRCLLNEGVMGGADGLLTVRKKRLKASGGEIGRTQMKQMVLVSGWMLSARRFSADRWPSLTFLPRSLVSLMISPVLRSLHPWNSTPVPHSPSNDAYILFCWKRIICLGSAVPYVGPLNPQTN